MECVYIEKVSGKNVTDRPVLTNLMALLKNGDKLIVDSISRFASNTKDLLELVEQHIGKWYFLFFIKTYSFNPRTSNLLASILELRSLLISGIKSLFNFLIII